MLAALAAGAVKPPGEKRIAAYRQARTIKMSKKVRYLTVPVTVRATNAIIANATGADDSTVYIGIGPEATAPGSSQ